MIANCVDSRLPLPFRRMPGAVERLKLAKALKREFGSRFAVFGRGWDRHGISAVPVPFAEQTDVLRNSWMSIIWNNYPNVPFYFSDRLPISLLSGILHITSHQPGYESMFRNGHDLVWCRTLDEMLDSVDYYLGRPREDLIELGRLGRDYARQHLTADTVLRNLIRQAADLRRAATVRNEGRCDV